MANRSPVTNAMVGRMITRNATAIDSPDGRVWLAVILQAIDDFSNPQYRHECEQYFKSRGFETACDWCGLNFQYTREIIHNNLFTIR